MLAHLVDLNDFQLGALQRDDQPIEPGQIYRELSTPVARKWMEAQSRETPEFVSGSGSFDDLDSLDIAPRHINAECSGGGLVLKKALFQMPRPESDFQEGCPYPIRLAASYSTGGPLSSLYSPHR